MRFNYTGIQNQRLKGTEDDNHLYGLKCPLICPNVERREFRVYTHLPAEEPKKNKIGLLAQLDETLEFLGKQAGFR